MPPLACLRLATTVRSVSASWALAEASCALAEARSARAEEAGLEIAVVDLEEHVALFDELVVVHEDVRHLARGPRGDVDDVPLDLRVVGGLVPAAEHVRAAADRRGDHHQHGRTILARLVFLAAGASGVAAVGAACVAGAALGEGKASVSFQVVLMRCL